MARAIGKNNKREKQERERCSVPLYVSFKYPFLIVQTSINL